MTVAKNLFQKAKKKKSQKFPKYWNLKFLKFMDMNMNTGKSLQIWMNLNNPRGL